MEVKVEKQAKSKVKLTITVSPKELIQHMKDAYSHLAPSVKLQGFRPGKAPKNLIESTLGISKLLSEALDMAINTSYVKALDEHAIHPISQPAIAVSKYPNYGTTEAEIANPLEYTVEVAVFPKVEIKDMSKVKVEKPKQETVTKEDVDKVLDNLRKQKSNFEVVDRAAEKGDFAEISFEGSIKKVKIDAMCSISHPLVIGEGSLIPGFEDQVVGMKKDETKVFKIKFPKDYHSKEFAGKEAEFSVTLKELKKVILPEVDEKFAADFGQPDAKTLISEIEKNLQLEYDQKYANDLEIKVIDAVLPLVTTEAPEEMVESELHRMIHAYEEQIAKMKLNLEDYLKNIGKTVEDLHKDMKPAAEKNVKIGLLIGKMVEDLKLDPNDKESGKKAIEHLVKEVTK